MIARKDPQQQLYSFNDDGESEEDDDNGNVEDESEDDFEIFEVEKILKICYGDPKEIKKRGLYLKVYKL